MTGKHMAHIRDELGLSQEQMAELLGVTARTVYRWEEHRSDISGAQARLLACLRDMPGNTRARVRVLLDEKGWASAWKLMINKGAR